MLLLNVVVVEHGYLQEQVGFEPVSAGWKLPGVQFCHRNTSALKLYVWSIQCPQNTKDNIGKKKWLRCDGSDGKSEGSGLKGPGFNSLPRQAIFSCFQLVPLEPMRSFSKYLPYCCLYM